MSDFKKFRALLQDHFNEMVKSENPLFVTDADEDELYNLYLDSFPAGTNELFRKRREYDCSCCRRFVKNIGKLVAFDKNYNLISIWDFDAKSAKYQPVVDALAAYVKSRAIGVNSNQFVPVSVAMYSPNYWDEQTGNGNRHYFFMLKDCVNPEKPNGFYNEFLKAELLQHKRVFEALGSQMAVQSVDDQLSGVGFSETKHDSFIVKIQGATERVLKVVI